MLQTHFPSLQWQPYIFGLSLTGLLHFADVSLLLWVSVNLGLKSMVRSISCIVSQNSFQLFYSLGNKGLTGSLLVRLGFADLHSNRFTNPVPGSDIRFYSETRLLELHNKFQADLAKDDFGPSIAVKNLFGDPAYTLLVKKHHLPLIRDSCAPPTNAVASSSGSSASTKRPRSSSAVASSSNRRRV